MRIKPAIILLILLFVIGGSAYAIFGGNEEPKTEAYEEGHDDHEEGHEEGEAHSEQTTITDEAAASMGIKTVQVGPATIRETRNLSGRVVLNQNASAQVKARFPGVVRGVFKQVGDPVRRGEKLATVESNESIQVYAVPSPLDGVVLERNISVGDTAADRPVFVVADLNSLWAEFFVFAGDMGAIVQGQKIIVRSLDGKARTESTLQTIQPTAEASSQTVLTRTELDNSTGVWRSGMTVKGDVVVQETAVNLAVPVDALQSFEGNDVVFVKEGSTYTAVPVKTGRADPDNVEVIEGLAAGQEVVSKGSFVVKADIGKAGAEHEH